MLLRRLLFYSTFVWPFVVGLLLYVALLPRATGFAGALIVSGGIIGMKFWWAYMERSGGSDRLIRRLRL